MNAPAYFYGGGSTENRLRKLETTPYFQMGLTADETIPANGKKRMGDDTYWTIDFDTEGKWDNTNREYEVPEDGQYIINWRERINFPSINQQTSVHFILVNNPDNTGKYAYSNRFNFSNDDTAYSRSSNIFTETLKKGDRVVFLNDNRQPSTVLFLPSNETTITVDGKTYKRRGTIITVWRYRN